MWTRIFWADAAERGVRTAAQVLVALYFAGETTILDVDWAQALAVAGTAAVVSVLTSIIATGVGDPSSPAIVSESRGKHRRD